MKTTRRHLDGQAALLNRLTGSPATPWQIHPTYEVKHWVSGSFYIEGSNPGNGWRYQIARSVENIGCAEYPFGLRWFSASECSHILAALINAFVAIQAKQIIIKD